MIDIKTDVCSGDPIIKGTRIRVSDVLGLLKEGITVDEVAEDYDLPDVDQAINGGLNI
ncbi:DUF433 domain-containing protein [Seinonella peptonophila]|uniref:DUF433 domain-containing protein n=1 Tax=Seinonella peptonophila TaxID=112248 RepID=UPI001C315454